MIDFQKKPVRVDWWVLAILGVLSTFLVSKNYLDQETFRSEQNKHNKEIVNTLYEIKTATQVQAQFNEYMKESVGRLEKRVEKLEEKTDR